MQTIASYYEFLLVAIGIYNSFASLILQQFVKETVKSLHYPLCQAIFGWMVWQCANVLSIIPINEPFKIIIIM